ncbi:RNase H domain [Carpediemonas membranifera]|uniref:RNase H domain n=1 Tax=Carpediemonas membranifera TaxID=201153 RepID=A0A8J6B8R4_9EUKA|nr:RNase H domain [Carpediemonas membranifera]|eukprot:KAG9395087.1 RNase H domain [Carpediemonas membranifera]
MPNKTVRRSLSLVGSRPVRDLGCLGRGLGSSHLQPRHKRLFHSGHIPSQHCDGVHQRSRAVCRGPCRRIPSKLQGAQGAHRLHGQLHSPGLGQPSGLYARAPSCDGSCAGASHSARKPQPYHQGRVHAGSSQHPRRPAVSQHRGASDTDRAAPSSVGAGQHHLGGRRPEGLARSSSSGGEYSSDESSDESMSQGYSSDSTYVPSEDLDLVDIPPRERHYVARVAPPQAGSSPEALLLDHRAPERHEVEVHRSGPSNLFEGIRLSDQLSHLEEQGRRAVAGWVTKFIESRDPKLSHAAQFRAFLLKEGRNSGPDSVGRKAYWVIQAAPRWSSWRVPLDAQAIQKEARKRATLKGLTGGSRPVYRIEMSDAIANRNSSIRAYQATLFASMCYLTVSRGREIFTLTPGRITFEPNGDATLGIPRTKTMIGVAKRLPNVWIQGF